MALQIFVRTALNLRGVGHKLVYLDGSLQELMRKHLHGGLAQTNLRYSRVKHTHIRKRKYGAKAKLVKYIGGEDATSMYPSVLAGELPIGNLLVNFQCAIFVCFQVTQ
jgi:hypothetical protein